MTKGFGVGTSNPGRSGLSNTEIYEWIATEVSSAVGEVISELFVSIKLKLIAMFDDHFYS